MQNTSSLFEFFNTDTDKITALLQKRCYIDNKEYVKGQKMFSGKNGCYACICDDGFDNTTLAMSTHCQRVKCNIDILYTDRVMAGCIPIYYGNAMCCPIGWKCRKRKFDYWWSLLIILVFHCFDLECTYYSRAPRWDYSLKSSCFKFAEYDLYIWIAIATNRRSNIVGKILCWM